MKRMPVMFSSNRDLERAENLKAVWDAYSGKKVFRKGLQNIVNIDQEGYSVAVVDEIPSPFLSKANLTVIFIGHGLTCGKTYGLDCWNTRSWCSGFSDRIDYAICSSEAGIPIMQKQLGLDKARILPYGMPRTDAYFDKVKGDGGTPLGKVGRAYLYAPTFRGRVESHVPNVDWDEVDRNLDPDEFLVVKPHMMHYSKLVSGAPKNRIVEVSNKECSTPYLIDCDVLITDYSSILFDGYFLNKPSVLFAPDIDIYLSSRGMYMPYPDWYGSKVLTENDPEAFVDLLRQAYSDGLGEVEKTCRKFTGGSCDGNASERVSGLITDLVERG